MQCELLRDWNPLTESFCFLPDVSAGEAVASDAESVVICAGIGADESVVTATESVVTCDDESVVSGIGIVVGMSGKLVGESELPEVLPASSPGGLVGVVGECAVQ